LRRGVKRQLSQKLMLQKFVPKFQILSNKIDGGMDPYDARWPATNSSSQENHITEYLNDPEVR